MRRETSPVAHADEFRVAARALQHGGFATWRTPGRTGHKGTSQYGLLHCNRWVATLGELTTGVTDVDLASFWARTLRRLRRLGLSEVGRQDVARQLIRKGVPLPDPTWSGADEPQWRDVVAEIAALIEDNELAT